ncbi:ABC transporter ATP-binding protein [Methylobacterium isbiliense]|uniref:Oligopeptide transport ATP-binding protein OppF n=1 Tax=Methylobacterium isbiliense TaxID=315478 RepID=A0ABQ4SDR4_9HYPH|nr:oligopeptide/dipeptide ABC transporter ATP-binding protein [Methylobacterium isbiliense]MDN3626753.1 ATP-binding cassette domain-containing protein [Methylobacterium isbiliense]GJE01229.1 Oligopeptide transport ATP-binding protein OppF [Methylobacterium isbiliense]
MPPLAEPILEVRDLAVHFATPHGTLRAVDGVSLSLRRGETLGLVGESGCGKSTLGRAILRLVEPTAGSIRLAGTDVTGLGRAALRPLRRIAQMVFQDPFASLDPRWTIGRLLAEPLVIHGIGDRAGRAARVRDLLDRVGLPADAAARYPHELSGGQRQRVGIARALALDPRLIVLDEAVSALDVSVQAQVLNLLDDLQASLGLAYLFISHDLAVVDHVADRIAVMLGGRLVETGPRARITARPLHPYTQDLLDAVPGRRARLRDDGEGEAVPGGCPFAHRCPQASARCRAEVPMLRPVGGEVSLACHHVALAAAA